ncbi:MAG: DUF1513 domain-containing protein [Pseudomonadota bacterium]
MTMLRRRDFMAGGALAALPFVGEAAPAPIALVGCCRRADGGYAVALVDASLTLVATLALPGRGHAIAVSPSRDRAVVLSRRPGRTATVIDLDEPRIVQTIRSSAGRHFLGHGFFSDDGERFFATENDYDNAIGALGVYDVAAGFARIDEWSTGGVGPHEALLLSDNRTIVVANGGIETHPDYPREKLNVASMRSSIAYLSVASGALLDVVERPPAYPSLSLRHMAEASDGAVWVGAQHEGIGAAPLVFRHRRGRALDAVLTADSSGELNAYVGDIGFDSKANAVVATSPRGHCVIRIDAATGKKIATETLGDVCGVSGRNGVWMSTGEGLLADNRGQRRRFDLAWDNHLVAV